MKTITQISLLSFSLIFLLACANDTKSDDSNISEAGKVAESTDNSQVYSIDSAQSLVMWEGYKPTGQHEGYIPFQSGEITVKDKSIESTSITFDMDQLTVTDENMEEQYRQKLQGHLRGTIEGREDDFFNVTKYPTASFELTEISQIENDTTGNRLVSGNLTIKDISKQVSFKAKVRITNKQVQVQSPQFKIDRTRWNINFKSKSIFDDLKNDFIYDEVGIAVDITAQKVNGDQ